MVSDGCGFRPEFLNRLEPILIGRSFRTSPFHPNLVSERGNVFVSKGRHAVSGGGFVLMLVLVQNRLFVRSQVIRFSM